MNSVRAWITICLWLVALMVLVGGLTRLTESGLSIVEWKLVSGTLPPLSESAWNAEFDAYKQTPQFEQVNSHFTLADFKSIYWLEYIHRVLGRVIGLALVVPFLYFAARKKLTPHLSKRMAVACLLVVSQGAVGWIMVASGLVDTPRVAPVKLAMHLCLAFALFGWLLWTRWEMDTPRPTTRSYVAMPRVIFLAVFVQVMLGAFVAGTDAGYSYNTFPSMDGAIVPSSEKLFFLQPWWTNHLENIMTVQFQHRAMAVLVTLLVFGFAFRAYRQADATQKSLLDLLAVVLVMQFVLGMATLLSHMNIVLASAHQLGALLLFFAALQAVYLYPRKKA